MKKIIILILVILGTTGCYDNIELNNLAIISGIGIDYYDDEYHLTYEILNDIKTEENTAMLSYIKEGAGKTIADAFVNTNLKVGKKPYFAHLRIVLFSESIASGHLDEISDYLLRDVNIRDEFISLVARDVSPKEILMHNSKNTPVVSDHIMNLINNEKYNDNLANEETFQKTLSKFISPMSDATLSSVTLKDDEISLSNFYIFQNYRIVNSLTKDESALYNLLTKNIYSYVVNKEYENGIVTININHSSSDIKVLNDKIQIDLKLEGRIIDNYAKFNLKDEKTYQKLNNDFKNILEKQITSFIKTLQANKSDILSLQEIYYKKMRKENQNLWLNADVLVNVDLKINTKGFIFEVDNEK